MLLTYKLLVQSMTVTSSLKKAPPHLMPLILTICGSEKVIGSKQLAIFVPPFSGLNTEEFFFKHCIFKISQSIWYQIFLSVC